MTDVEEIRPGRRVMSNPYAGQPLPVRSKYHPINILQRTLWMGGSVYLLDRMDTYDKIMTSPDISHGWFKAGLAAAVGEYN
jgi:hypothetical protein